MEIKNLNSLIFAALVVASCASSPRVPAVPQTLPDYPEDDISRRGVRYRVPGTEPPPPTPLPHTREWNEIKQGIEDAQRRVRELEKTVPKPYPPETVDPAN